MYYVIEKDADGDVVITEFEDKELLDKLKYSKFGPDVSFRDSIDGEQDDPNCWTDEEILIIKGHIVVPTENRKIRDFSLD